MLNKIQNKFSKFIVYFFILAFVTIFGLFLNVSHVSAATVNSPVCTTFSYNPTQLGPPGSLYLDVGATTYVQFYGSDSGGSGSKVKITFTDTGGPGTSVVGLPANYTSLPGQTTLLKNFPFTGITAGTARNIQVDFQVLDVGDVPICWNRINYQVTITTLPSPDFSLVISPLTANVVQTNKTSYSIYANCNRAFNGANTISGLSFSPGGLTNVSATFSSTNLTCGNYSYVTISTTQSSGPASTPGSPNSQAFTVSGTASAYGITRNSSANLVIYGLPTVSLVANPNAVSVGGSTALTWTTTYTDTSVNAGKPCNLYQGGTLAGTRANTLSSPGETRGPLNSAGTVRFDLTCQGFGGFQGIGTAFVTVTASPNNVFIQWSLNGEIQTGSLAASYPGLSYTIDHRQIGGANCTAIRQYCNDSTQSDAPVSFSLATNFQYRVRVTAAPGGIDFTGITPPGEQPQLVSVPYPPGAWTNELAIPNASSTKITFTLNFIDYLACPDYNNPPYNTSNYYIGIASSTAVPPASIKNVTIGDAALLSPEPHFSGGTYRADGSGQGTTATYDIVNGNLLRPLTYGNGNLAKLFGASGDWVWVDDTTGKHAYGCGLNDTSFRINDFNHTVSTLTQTKNQGETAVYSMSQLSKNQFNQPISFLIVSSNLPTSTYVTFCDGSNNCSSSKTLTPAIGGTVNGYVRIGTDSTTPAGTYTFVVRARYAGNYSNNDKDSVTLTLVVNSVTPAPTVSITAPAGGTNVVYGNSTTIQWTSTNANVNGCGITSVPAGTNLSSLPQSGSQAIAVTADTTFTVTCAGPGGSGNANVSVVAVPGDPSNIKTYNTNTDPTGNPTPCGDIKVAWNTVTGAQGYYLYTSPVGALVKTVVGGTTGSTFYTPAGSNSYYVAAYADYGSGIKTGNRVGATPPPSQPIAPVPSPCPPNVSNSDLDVTLVDGASVNTPSNCDGQPDPVNNPAAGKRDYLVGAVVKYKINICNSGVSSASAISAVIKLSNLEQPSTGWNFVVSCGGCSNQASPTPSGTGTPGNPFVWNFGSATLNAGNSWYITFEAKTALPAGSTQSDYYAYAYGDINLSGVSAKAIASNFVHFRVGNNPEIKEVQY